MTEPLDIDAIARAFSGHRFGEAFPYLADNVRWFIPGQMVVEGADAVIAACRATGDELVDTTVSWLRFVSVADAHAVAVDTVARYQAAGGETAVSSCDIYQFVDGKIGRITSYAVEVDPDDVDSSSPPNP